MAVLCSFIIWQAFRTKLEYSSFSCSRAILLSSVLQKRKDRTSHKVTEGAMRSVCIQRLQPLRNKSHEGCLSFTLIYSPWVFSPVLLLPLLFPVIRFAFVGRLPPDSERCLWISDTPLPWSKPKNKLPSVDCVQYPFHFSFCAFLFAHTVEPQYNEVPRDWKYVRYKEASLYRGSFHIFYC